jgi:GNAT superfamily N-acetyltransferase
MYDRSGARAPALKGQIRTLAAQEMPLLRDHLERLDATSRHDRFNGFIDEGFIGRYAAKCALDGTIVVAYVEDGVVRAAAELHRPDQADPLPEIAFSVESPLRRQGLGSQLFTRLIGKARSLGYDSLRITTGSENQPMRALARKFGAHLTFGRGESSGTIDLASQNEATNVPMAVSVPTPVDVARAMMKFNRAYWKMWFRMAGLDRAA